MTKRLIGRRPGLALGLFLAGTFAAASVALAQGPPGPPPPFGGPGGPPPTSAASIPLAMLDAKLKLTSDQDAKITQIQKDFRQQRDTLMPRPGQRPDGPPPDRDSMSATRDKVHALDTTASDKISAVLTVDQQKALAEALAETEALRADGIPLEVYGDLKLTADQEKQLTTIGQAAIAARKQARTTTAAQAGPPDPDTMRQARQQTDAKVAAVLTATQRQTLDAFQQTHSRPGPGGPSGQGPGAGPDGAGPPPPDGNGPPPMDGDGPPPPDGNGPPPPDDNGPPPPDGGPGGPPPDNGANG